MTPWFMLWAAYRWTGDTKYIVPFSDNPVESLRTINADALDMLKMRGTWGKELMQSVASDRPRGDGGSPAETNLHLAWQMTGDTTYLDKLYARQIETAVDREFINTRRQFVDRSRLLQQRRAATCPAGWRGVDAELYLSGQCSELAV